MFFWDTVNITRQPMHCEAQLAAQLLSLFPFAWWQHCFDVNLVNRRTYRLTDTHRNRQTASDWLYYYVSQLSYNYNAY